MIRCNVCGTNNDFNAETCIRCMKILNLLDTHRLEELESTGYGYSAGDIVIPENAPIRLLVGKECLLVQIAERFVLGRLATLQQDDPPDLPLNQFNAFEHGISRRHALIERRNLLLYLSDMKSANGTYLNGRRLAPDEKRLLRHCDVIQLGSLELRIDLKGDPVQNNVS